MEVTKVNNATRVFKIGEVETKALRGVNLSINDGEFTALVGPSGSGKTTLLQLIGLLDKPTTGSVTINGQEATNLNRNQRADLRKNAIGFVFQFFALIPTLTAYENVEMPLLLTGMKPAERKKRVNEMLEAVGTPGPRPSSPRSTFTVDSSSASRSPERWLPIPSSSWLTSLPPISILRTAGRSWTS